jgi:cell division protein FtsL
MRKFERAFLWMLIFAIPAVLFANVWFSYRYYALNEHIADLEEQQQELIERNKRLITGITILRSPGRIIQEARELGLTMAGREQIQLVEDDS